MASIDKLPSGKYRIRVYDKYTKKQKTFTASTKSEAKRLASQWEFMHDNSKDMTVEECVKLYIENRSNTLSPSTIRSYILTLENRMEDIRYRSAKNLTSEEVQRFVNDLSAKYSPKTVKNTYSLISAILRTFYPDKAIHVRMPQSKPVERHIPTEDDVKKLVQMAGPDLRKCILLASAGTLRRGEIAALTYGDIDNNTIHVHADIVYDENGGWIYKDVPKTSESDRYVEYPPEIIEELGTGEPDERIVKFKTPDTITAMFIRLRNKLGLQCRFHDLRAYSASIMHAIGVPDAVIMKRGGWKTATVMQQCYRHALDDKMKAEIDKTNEYMKKLVVQ